MGRLEITLVKSMSGQSTAQRAVVRSLGLRRLNQTVLHDDNERTRGKVRKVSHLLRVKSLEE